MARVREPPMASNDDSASLLVDERSPPPAVVTPAASSPLRRLLHGRKKAATRPLAAAATTTTRSHDVMRFICLPFAAVLRAMSCARDAAVSTCGEKPSKVAAEERLREARTMRRPSLEQLLRMEAPPPPPPAAASAGRPDHHQRKPLLGGKARESAAAPRYEVISSCAAAVKGKEQEPLFPSPQRHFGERRRTTIVPVKLEAAAAGSPGPGRQTKNARRLVVVFASLRACSRAPRINDGKVKVAAAGRAPGKAELFYYRPIPMGRRCRVQHLEESPYSATASSDLSSLLDLGVGQM